MEKQKKIALINDMSCIGRCSLTAAIPIISACGFQSVPLPTGIFSAHTEFDGFVCADMTKNLQNFAVKIGVLATPQKFVRGALKRLFKRKSQYVNGLLNKMASAIVPKLPVCVKMQVKYRLLDKMKR